MIQMNVYFPLYVMTLEKLTENLTEKNSTGAVWKLSDNLYRE